VCRLILLLGCLLIGSAGPAYALRCGTGVVSTGAHKFEVLQKCGEPDFAEERVIHETRYVAADGRYYTGLDYPHHEILPGYRLITIPILIEHWTYNFGPHRLVYRLRFVDGGLRDISTHGSGD
jgi:hypothetical protein